MSESKKPKPSQPKFLPRTWKAAPEPEDEPKEPVKGSARAKKDKPAATKDATGKPSKKPKADQLDDGTGGSKLEETPILDTYEGRRLVRIAVGSVLSLVGIIGILLVVRAVQPSAAKVDPNAESRETKNAVDPKESLEREAAALIENAKQSDKLGRFNAAIVLLRKVARNYEGTTAAKEANAALDRERRNRPLFEVESASTAPGPVAPANGVAATGTGKASTAPAAPTPTGPLAPTAPAKPPEIVVRALPNGFRAETSAPVHPSGWPTRITCDRDGAVMLLVPGGEFLMGREDGDSSERPSHRVKLSAYYIDEHEVTNRQYQTYLKESGRASGDVPKPIDPARLELPVTGLTAREARAYCYWANRRLPSEAQWEMAARSADGRVSYGFAIKEPARGDANPRILDAVMSLPADRSPLGGFDFAANAWEWTSDYYDAQYYNQARGVMVDPSGPLESRIKPAQVTVKGGSKLGFLTWREGVRIEGKLPQLGFRGALPVEAVQAPPPVNQPSTPGVNPSGGAMPF